MRRSAPIRRDAGFTLVEVLVVLVILALLAAVAVPSVLGYLAGARSDTARLQIDSLRTALDLYRLDAGRYPTAQEGLGVLVQKPANTRRWNGPYLRDGTLPVDPWGRAFLYRADARGGGYELLSLGSDGREGGTGEDADIAMRSR